MLKTKKIICVLTLLMLLIFAFCLPVSALDVNSYGFTITDQKFGSSSSMTPNFTQSSGVTVQQYGDNQIEFKFAQGNGSSTSAYRPMSFNLTAGNSNPKYSVNIQFVSYYADASNAVYGFDGAAWAYINNSRVTALQPYSRTPSNNSSLYYTGGSFAFNINSNQTLKITLCSGYNEGYLQTVGFGVWVTVSPVDQSGAIIDNQNQNTQDVIDNQNQNTQDVIDNQNDLYDREHNEVEQNGNAALDGTGEIPNQSEGFISALGDLVQAFSYNGTRSTWVFPEVSIPEIAGVIPETKLISQQQIDFEFWVNKIPENILTLIRYVLSGSLIVYCFKELYSTISYVLTLKGGGN